MYRVLLPPLLRDLCNSVEPRHVEATTLGELLVALDAQVPGIGPRLRSADGRLRPFLTLVAGGKALGRFPETRLPPADAGAALDVWFLVAVAGG